MLLPDVWAATGSGGGKSLIEGLREMHPEIPVLLTAPGMELDWIETKGVHKLVASWRATAERLDAAIKEALADEPGGD